jgi:hypothetical protein
MGGGGVIFINNGQNRGEVRVNDTIQRVFDCDLSPRVQHIAAKREQLREGSVDVIRQEGFVGDGTVLEGHDGVSVDSSSLRSNGGFALFGSDRRISRQVNEISATI